MKAQPLRLATPADFALIAESNRTEMPFPQHVTLPGLIEEQVAKQPNETAVICDHDSSMGAPTLTYAQLNDRVNQLAHLLRDNGVGPGSVVALMVDRSFAMIVGIFGIIKAGGAYLPISADHPPERLAYLLKDGGVQMLLYHQKTANRTPSDVQCIDLDDSDTYRGSTMNPPILNTSRDLAYVIYTSGSTGKPKGVMIEQRSLVNRLHWMQHAYPIGSADVLLQKTPYTFDVSVWELFWWVLQGAKLCFLTPGGERNPMALVEAVKKNRVTVLHFVPSMLGVFLDYLEAKPTLPKTALSSVRQVFASGEALTPSHVKRFNDLWSKLTGARLTNLYGPTEATIDVTYFDCPAQNNFDLIPIGRPIHNTKLYVLRDGWEVAVGEEGELCIAGVGLARGYLNDAVRTEEKFTDNPANPGERIYRTGDVARRLPNGDIEYLGREDHQVKIRGMRIELGEIENNIRDFPGVTDCVVQVKKLANNVTPMVAHVVCRSDLDLEQLRSHLKNHLPDYMIPNRFDRLAEMPLTPSGKADRKALQ